MQGPGLGQSLKYNFTPSEQHRVERLLNGLWKESRQGLIAFKFETIRELIEATKAFEACLKECQQG